MNSILFENDSLTTDNPSVVNHLRQNLKSKIGDELRCTVLGEKIVKARLMSLSETSAQFEKIYDLDSCEPWFDLLVGVSRPQTTKKILEHATTFGVRNIIFFNAQLSEKSYLDSKIFEPNEIQTYLNNGLSQSGVYYRLPSVNRMKLNAAIDINQNFIGQKFILDLTESKSFLDLQISFQSPPLLAIGPERGFTEQELNIFKNNEFRSIKLSSSILRVEHAIYSAISQLELIRKKF